VVEESIAQPERLLCIDVSSSDIFDEDREKRDDARLTLQMNMVDLYWFRPSRRVIALC
jgi:hypothetical protein